MIAVVVVCGVALIATMLWVYSVGLSASRAIAIVCFVVGGVSGLVGLGRIDRGRPNS